MRSSCRSLAALPFALFLLAAEGQAASFDCSKASTTQEELICRSPRLLRLDDLLAAVYVKWGDNAVNPTARKLQLDWRRRVRNACTNEPCLVEAYRARLEVMQGDVAELYGTALHRKPLPEKATVQDVAEPEAAWTLVTQQAVLQEFSVETIGEASSWKLVLSNFSSTVTAQAVNLSCRDGTAGGEGWLYVEHDKYPSGDYRNALFPLQRMTVRNDEQLRGMRPFRAKPVCSVASVVLVREDRRGDAERFHQAELAAWLRSQGRTQAHVEAQAPRAPEPGRAANPKASASPLGPVPRNPSGSRYCKTAPVTSGRFGLCDDPKYSRMLDELRITENEADRAIGSIKESTRRAVMRVLMEPVNSFMDYPEKSCSGMEPDCLETQARTLGRRLLDQATERSRLLKAAEERAYDRETKRVAGLPVHVDGRTKEDGRVNGQVVKGNFADLYVYNRTKKGLSQLDVTCGLYESNSDEQPVDSTVFRQSIRANIAPESGPSFLGRFVVPWNVALWQEAHAWEVKCQVLNTADSTPQDTQAAIAQWDRDIARVEAARKQLLEDTDRRDAERQMNQTQRLAAALREARLGSPPQCRGLSEIFTQELVMIRKYEAANVSAYGLVERIVGDLRRQGCIR